MSYYFPLLPNPITTLERISLAKHEMFQAQNYYKSCETSFLEKVVEIYDKTAKYKEDVVEINRLFTKMQTAYVNFQHKNHMFAMLTYHYFFHLKGDSKLYKQLIGINEKMQFQFQIFAESMRERKIILNPDYLLLINK